MRKLASNLIFLLGLFTLLFSVYVITFFITLNKAVRPFERANFYKTHPFRPVYNVVYYPMRKFIANGSSFKPEKVEWYYGTLKRPFVTDGFEARLRSARIETPEQSDVLFDFTGKRSILNDFDEVEFESYVRLVFGTALSKDHDRFINRLIEFEIIDLVDDPRIKDKEYSDDKRRTIETEYSKLSGVKKVCAKTYEAEYKERVLEHCLQAGYAQNIGGGCYHLVPYSVTTSVLEAALDNCSPSSLLDLKETNLPK